MLAQALVDEIRRLLDEKRLSQRQIARSTGVSRGTIGRIASGTRLDRQPQDTDDRSLIPTGPPQRCAGCGGLVYMPCLLCTIRARAAQSRKPGYRHVPEPAHAIGLEQRHEIQETVEGDYRFVVLAQRSVVAQAVAQMVTNIDYGKFIHSIHLDFGSQPGFLLWMNPTGVQVARVRPE
jgi:hypothetical protein